MMSKLSKSAANVAATLAVLEGQIETFLTEAETVRKAAVIRGPKHSVEQGDPEAAKAWSRVTQATNSALSRGHAKATGKPVPARTIDLLEIYGS